MVKYSVAMAIRVVCLIALLFVHGWWLILPAVGAIFLPYFAVVIANDSKQSGSDDLEGPGGIVPVTGSAQPEDDRSSPSGEKEEGA